MTPKPGTQMVPCYLHALTALVWTFHSAFLPTTKLSDSKKAILREAKRWVGIEAADHRLLRFCFLNTTRLSEYAC